MCHVSLLLPSILVPFPYYFGLTYSRAKYALESTKLQEKAVFILVAQNKNPDTTTLCW